MDRNPVTPEWRDAMVAECQRHEGLFSPLHPDVTGLDKTIYASEDEDFPTVIIDSRLGKYFSPTDDAVALAFGENSGDTKIDDWLRVNTNTLISFCHGKYDSIDLYANLKNYS